MRQHYSLQAVKRDGLLGEAESGRREGPVTLRLVDPENETLRPREDFDAAAYEIACQAPIPNRPVQQQGILRRAGCSHRIDEVSDFRFLEPGETVPERTG